MPGTVLRSGGKTVLAFYSHIQFKREDVLMQIVKSKATRGVWCYLQNPSSPLSHLIVSDALLS